jgi:predicted nucleic acid-binding protein
LIVLDASVVVDLLLDRGRRSGQVMARLEQESSPIAAPHLIDAEVGHALRRAVLRGGLTAAVARSALSDLAALQIERFDHAPLLARAFALRGNASFYDALYLALAEILDARLLTRDQALARVPGTAIHIEVV